MMKVRVWLEALTSYVRHGRYVVERILVPRSWYTLTGPFNISLWFV